MELIGLVLGAPLVLIVTAGYCAIAMFVLTKLPRVRPLVLVGSLLAVLCLLGEIGLLCILGGRASYSRFGVGFTVLHITTVILVPPAAANLFLLQSLAQDQMAKALRIFLASLTCWFACMSAVLWNISVDEAIVGVNAPAFFSNYDPANLPLEGEYRFP